MAFERIRKALREVMSEPGLNGMLSWGRVASSFCLIASIVWITYLLYKGLPIKDVPWRDVTYFILAPYGANRIATTVQAFSSNPVTPNPNQPTGAQIVEAAEAGTKNS